jgi:hypothetical protein
LVRNSAASGGAFCVGAGATTPDFHVWEMCDQVSAAAAAAASPSSISNTAPQFNLLATFYKLSNPLLKHAALGAFHDK